LNVQQVTSSIVYSCGSNIFGCSTSDVQQMTGSVRITGSLNVIGNACMTSICSPSIVGGTVSGTTIYGSTAICGGVICGGATTLTGALSGTSATFSGNLNLQGAVTRNINFYDSSNTNINAQIQYDQISSNSGQLFFGTNNAGTFATRLTISNTGAATFSSSVNIGTTASTVYGTLNVIQQSVSAPSFVRGIELVHPNGTGGTGGYIGISMTGQKQATIQVGDDSAAGNLLLQSQGGNVGIGTSSPTEKLDVRGNIYTNATNTNIYLDNGGVGGASLKIGVTGTTETYINSLSDDPLIFLTNNTERMRITSGGKVGIGLNMTTPVSQVSIGVGNVSTVGALASAGLAINSYDSNIVVGNLSQISFGLQNVYTPAYIGYVVTTATAYSYGDLIFGTRGVNTDTQPTERMRITSGGNVVIGNTVASNVGLTIYGSNAATIYQTANTGTGANNGFYVGHTGDVSYIWNYNNYPTVFGTNNTERMRITSGGNVLIGTTTDPNAGVIVGSQSTNNWTIYGKNTASSGTVYVYLAEFTGQAPNNSGTYFYYAGDTIGQRFSVRGNGGISNYQANNVNLSDISTKKDIIPCESYWDKFKAIEIVKFKYKDQSHDDYNIGVIAQQVEEVAPEFVDEENWGKPNEEPNIKKAIYTADLNHATIKVLQEAINKIETLEAQIEELKNK